MQSQRTLARLTPLFAVVTLPAGILAAIYFGLSTALVVFVVGWLLLTPASAILFGAPANPGPGSDFVDDEQIQELVQERMNEKIRESTSERSSTDPVEKLRERYAQGEIDEAELERRLDAILEMEDVDPEDEESIERAKRNVGGGEPAGRPGERQDIAPESKSKSESESSDLLTDRE